ncbi:WD40-repeat-containing domain protein [Peziza echinospora]|nr:WD40-repeat-containing domain protein [Peziza echinospora]
MSKRSAETIEEPTKLKNGQREEPVVVPAVGTTEHDLAEMGEFEDQYGDDFESDDEVLEAGADGNPDPDSEDDEEQQDLDGDTAMDEDPNVIQVYLPSRRTLGKDEILEPDPSAYDMLHSINTTWPCLSFDIIKDGLGDERRNYPATTYLVAGSQAERANKNEITVLKLSSLNKMPQDDDEDEEEDEDSDTEDDPILESRIIPVQSTINRIRAGPHSHESSEHLIASMNENGNVLIHDIHSHILSFDTPGLTIPTSANSPLVTLKMHGRTEGYAIDWSPLSSRGQLLTGDNNGKIFLTSRTETGGWKTDANPFTGHTGSIEEIQWSPTQPTIFASGSSDGTVKIWDLRSKKHKPQLSVDVSSSDINVMSWNKRVDFLLATGADDGVWGVWDLRTFPSAVSSSTPIVPTAQFTFHQSPITSIEFHPTEDSIVSVASADNTVTLWDLGVELDDEESRDTAGVEDIPPQLLFVHYMKDVKEAHWHPQIPGMMISTGGDGLGVFKTISV